MKFLSVLAFALLTAISSNAATPIQAAAAASKGAACVPIGDFYWEVGDKNGVLTSGSSGTQFSQSTVTAIASASKWIYGAYATEKGFLESNRKYLNFTSGYRLPDERCSQTDTVGSCGSRATIVPSSVGKFDYGGGHMQHFGAITPLASMNPKQLSTEISKTLGIDVVYGQPLLAGGVITSAAEYGKFLRKMMDGSLKLGARLGEKPVCTLPQKCATAIASPARPHDWDYSIGHWVERDIDGSFSSAGSFGFYPWISKDKKLYGIISTNGPSGFDTANCGSAIRAAYVAALPVETCRGFRCRRN